MATEIIQQHFKARYFNSNDVAVAIVAAATYHDRELFDWAAYMGGSTKVYREEDYFDDVADHGSKLSHKDAQYFFPRLSIEKYRE